MGQDFMHLSHLSYLLIYSYVGVVHWPVIFTGVQSVNIVLGLYGIGHGIWDWEITIMMIDDRGGETVVLDSKKMRGPIASGGKPSRWVGSMVVHIPVRKVEKGKEKDIKTSSHVHMGQKFQSRISM